MNDNSMAYRKKDRISLLAFAEAINASETQLRRDDCGDWYLVGTEGHVYAHAAAFLLGVRGKSARGWSSAKKRLAFCHLTQDGEDEGCLYLNRLPDELEAGKIRAVLHIRKRMAISEETKARLAAQLQRNSSPANGQA